MWIITKDNLYTPSMPGDKDKSGTTSGDYDAEKFAKLKSRKKVYKFRMRDDDYNDCYHGYCTSWDDDNAFTPLDDFGTPYAGCTAIEYQNPITHLYEML